MACQLKTNGYYYIKLYKQSDLLRPVHVTRDCPGYEDRGFFDRLPRAIVRDGIVYGDTKEVDKEGFRVYIEDENIWHARGALEG